MPIKYGLTQAQKSVGWQYVKCCRGHIHKVQAISPILKPYPCKVSDMVRGKR